METFHALRFVLERSDDSDDADELTQVDRMITKVLDEGLTTALMYKMPAFTDRAASERKTK